MYAEYESHSATSGSNGHCAMVIQANPSAVSLFSGCGGFCEGIKKSGFGVKVAVELDKYACETYRFNFPSVPLHQGDVSKFLLPNTDHQSVYDLHNIDLVFGGPPCQGFSQIGERRLDDARNSLYKEYSRIVYELRPKLFLLENVPNLALMNKGYFRKCIIKEFAAIGYSNTTMLRVGAEEFGVPQSRQRVIFVGTRDEDGFPYDLDAFCSSVLSKMKQQNPVTVSEAIGDLPGEIVHSGELMDYPNAMRLSRFMREMRLDCDGEVYSMNDKELPCINQETFYALHNHHTKEIQAKRAHLISLLEPGKKANSLPKEVWNNKRPEKWRRLHPDWPAHTILAQMHRDLSEWIHPSENRWITVREAARLQSFHDAFIFKGSEWQQLKQVGNAVPPLLAYTLGKLAMAILAFNESSLFCEPPICLDHGHEVQLQLLQKAA